MKSVFKWLAIAVGALVLLVVAAVVVLPMFFDPNDFRDEMVAQVKKQTGRDLVIDGDQKWSTESTLDESGRGVVAFAVPRWRSLKNWVQFLFTKLGMRSSSN